MHPLKLKMTASICTLKPLFHCKANMLCVLTWNKAKKKKAVHISLIPSTSTHVLPASAAPAVHWTPRNRAEEETRPPQGWRRKRKQTGKMETKRKRRKRKEEKRKEKKALGWSRCGWGRRRWFLVSGCWRWFWWRPSLLWNSSDLSGPEGTKHVREITAYI